MQKYNVGLMDLKKKPTYKKSPAKGSQSAQLVDFVQGNDLNAFEKNENITSLSRWYKFNTSNLLFPETGFIKGTIQICSLNFSV